MIPISIVERSIAFTIRRHIDLQGIGILPLQAFDLFHHRQAQGPKSDPMDSIHSESSAILNRHR